MKTGANLVGGQWVTPSGAETLHVHSPYTGLESHAVPLSRDAHINDAVAAAKKALPAWRALPIRERTQPLARLRNLMMRDLPTLAALISSESGKTKSEAQAELEKAIEVIDFALSLPNLNEGGEMEVSKGITCSYRREPVGIVAGITPFNFPAMVGFWMIPNALTLGNCFIWKPSEKVAQTPHAIGHLFCEAGFPDGVMTILNGDRQTVELLCDHPDIAALGFVGSTPVARAVYARAAAQGKRVLCLGSAKNHLVIAPDADVATTAQAVVDSFTGCAGQRCMAGSVLVAVNGSEAVVDAVAKEAQSRELGRDIGCLIDHTARQRLFDAIEKAKQRGVKVLCDGRQAKAPAGFEKGAWMGPVILEVPDAHDPCSREEWFGPVLTVVRVKDLSSAAALDHANIYGNASVIFTRDGATARQWAEQSASGMIGVNVGIPVPREPFSFGGTKASKFGHGEITGLASLSLWSDLKKITSKWKDTGIRHWMG